MTENDMMISLSGLISNTGVTYSAQSNAFLTRAYVSSANNAYFNAIRFADGIIIKEDVGQGHTHTFLNALRIYHIESKTLLADKSFHCCYYSKETVKVFSKAMLMDLLENAAQKSGQWFSRSEAEQIVERVLEKAFQSNQIEQAKAHSRIYLGQH